MCIEDVTGEEVKCITEDGARMLRAAAMDADRVPVASMLPIGLELVTLQPGERAILPVKWDKCSGAKITECSTHPEAPTGLVVSPGPCGTCEEMSVVVENEAPVPITITEKDLLVICVGEDDVPSLDECYQLMNKRERFPFDRLARNSQGSS